MSRSIIVSKSQLLGAATALSTMGFLIIPAPAHADPMFPLAPPCTQYGFIGDVALRQSNGFRVEFSSRGPAATGRATATGGNGATMGGNVSGGIQGRSVDFTIRWDGGGATGHYTGFIGDDDFVHGGTSVDEVTPSSRASWDSTVPFACLDAPPAPPPPAAPAPAPPAAPAPAPAPATVTGDVDVYDAPGGDGNVIGILRQGQQVQLQGACNKDDWCQVVGQGWVWGHLQF
jgi:hypothetical protein